MLEHSSFELPHAVRSGAVEGGLADAGYEAITVSMSVLLVAGRDVHTETVAEWVASALMSFTYVAGVDVVEIVAGQVGGEKTEPGVSLGIGVARL